MTGGAETGRRGACRVMGIVNVTPDSFSDGGRYCSPEEAIRRARNLIADGADLIDVGGESTRPGATPIGWEEEWARVRPVLAGLADCGVPLSVDTYHPETAERALGTGAKIINCVFAEPAAALCGLIRSHPGAELVLPATAARSVADGDLRARIYADPMIGFGTTREEDLALLRDVGALARDFRVLVGASRKRIVKRLTGGRDAVGKSVGGNVAIALWCAAAGASVVRVHDVRDTVDALRVWHRLRADSFRDLV